ncbi:hypothetical protein [Chthonobacter rhizosphaerae]|uniref:hypothetical protein n=1 Tax=Chthonobacter rhizosphaerae TaxID=2735553 RepID=UPI0015EE44D1|nr:hypothetical protein [Chthonobacter rhizosphaerae]
MINSFRLRLIAGALAGAVLATAIPSPASAGEASLVITVDHRNWQDRGWDDRRWDDRDWRDRDWRDDRPRWDRPHRDRRWKRHRDRFVEICEPVWKVRKSYDRYGRVDKVVRVRVDECRLVRR